MILPILAKFWREIALACLALALWGAVKYGSHEHNVAEQATEIANQNAAIADQERADRKKADDIATQYAEMNDAFRRKLNTQRTKVAHAGKELDGPLSPILRSILDGLPKPATEADKTKS